MSCLRSITHMIRRGDNLYRLAQVYQTTVRSILAQNPGINPYNLLIGTELMICPGENFFEVCRQQPSACPDPSKQMTLTNDMRKVWEQHVYWTRMLLISIASRLPDQEAVTARLLRNPADIANIFAEYYDEEAANAIERLLTEHLQIGAALITALRDGNTAEAENLKSQWFVNADEMADAFSSINPYYQHDAVRQMLHRHLDLTTKEVTLRLAGDYPADIAAFDEVEEEALMMADYFIDGIMRQFPEKFQ